MKKLFFLLVVAIGLSITTTAQRATTMPLIAGDTVNNTGSASKVITLTAGYAGIEIQADVTKLSGTVGGTMQLFKSLDGTTYTQVGSDQTVTNTTGTKAYVFTVTAPVPVFLRVIHTGTGTMSSVLTVKYVFRKYSN